MPHLNCPYGDCHSSSRRDKNVKFLRFPQPCTDRKRTRRWVALCNRKDFTIDKVNRNTFICEKHFEPGAVLSVKNNPRLEPFPYEGPIQRVGDADADHVQQAGHAHSAEIETRTDLRLETELARGSSSLCDRIDGHGHGLDADANVETAEPGQTDGLIKTKIEPTLDGAMESFAPLTWTQFPSRLSVYKKVVNLLRENVKYGGDRTETEIKQHVAKSVCDLWRRAKCYPASLDFVYLMVNGLYTNMRLCKAAELKTETHYHKVLDIAKMDCKELADFNLHFYHDQIQSRRLCVTPQGTIVDKVKEEAASEDEDEFVQPEPPEQQDDEYDLYVRKAARKAERKRQREKLFDRSPSPPVETKRRRQGARDDSPSPPDTIRMHEYVYTRRGPTRMARKQKDKSAPGPSAVKVEPTEAPSYTEAVVLKTVLDEERKKQADFCQQLADRLQVLITKLQSDSLFTDEIIQELLPISRELQIKASEDEEELASATGSSTQLPVLDDKSLTSVLQDPCSRISNIPQASINSIKLEPLIEFNVQEEAVPKANAKTNPTAKGDDDHLVTTECVLCGRDVLDEDFAKHFAEHERRLDPDDRLPKCPICGTSLSHWTDLSNHIWTDHPEWKKKFYCMICKNFLQNRGNLIKHWESHDPEEGVCRKCFHAFATRHELKEHNCKPPDMNPRPRISPYVKYAANKLSSSSSSIDYSGPQDKDAVAVQLNREEAPPVVDTGLPEMPKNRSRKGQLTPKDFAGAPLITCSDCGLTFWSQDDLERHEQLQCVKGRRTCQVCHFKIRLAEFDGHNERHKEELKEVKGVEEARDCPFCEAKIEPFRMINVHLTQSHHVKSKVFCVACDRLMSDVSLGSHWLKKHMPEVECLCDDCGKIFRNKKSLHQHNCSRNLPLAERPRDVVCDQCGRAFLTQQGLRTHIRNVHTEEEDKKYVCELDGKRYAGARDYMEHVFVHQNIKPFKCTICEFVSHLNYNVVNHVRGIHQQKITNRDVIVLEEEMVRQKEFFAMMKVQLDIKPVRKKANN